MDDNKKTGPEFAPIREYIKSLPILVTIYDADDIVIREERMDYGKDDDRKWLGKLSVWAWANNHIVESKSIEKL